MNIHEFQAKDIFKPYHIPVPPGSVATTPEEAEQIAHALGGRVVVKAQIPAGGRGKGHILGHPEVRGVKVVDTPQAARAHAQALLGHFLKTHQTGPEGQKVKRVLVEAASSIQKELYAGAVLGRDAGRITLIASTEGGMDIEEVAASTPDKIFQQAIDPATGWMPFYGRKLAEALNLTGHGAKQAQHLFAQLYAFFTATDASLVEINPLAITGDGNLLALDAKVNLDDNALFRHPDLAAYRDLDEEDARERQARDANLSYIALQGTIGCLVNGAGLAMATMDIIKYAGGEPANFLDVGGSASAQQVTQAFKIILTDPQVRAILVNIFAGIAKCDVIAEGVVSAAQEVGLKVPLVCRLEGTHVELGKRILEESGLAIIPATDMLDAAQKVVRAAGGRV